MVDDKTILLISTVSDSPSIEIKTQLDRVGATNRHLVGACVACIMSEITDETREARDELYNEFVEALTMDKLETLRKYEKEYDNDS